MSHSAWLTLVVWQEGNAWWLP